MSTAARPEPTAPDLPAHAPADEKALLGLMKAWRRGRATTNLMAALESGYVALLTIGMLGAMLINLIITTQRDAAGCATTGCLSARTLLPWALFAGVLVLSLFLARLFGPVLASAAEGFWLLDAPIRRSRILRGRLIAIVAVAAGIGAVLGALVATLTGSAVPAILAWTVATALGAAAIIALAAAEQGAERTVVLRVVQALAGLAGVAVLALVVAIATGMTGLDASQARSEAIAWVVAGVAALVLVASFVLAWQRLYRIRRARLQSGGALVAGMQGAAFALDLGLMRDILVEREAVLRGHVNPTMGRGTGLSALVWRDVQRLLRYPRPLLGVLVSVIVPYAVSALGLAQLSPFISGVVLCFMLVPFLQSLRVLSRTPGLARMLPFGKPAVRQACMVVAGLVALVWALVTIPAFWGVATTAKQGLLWSVGAALITGFAALMGAVRWTTAREVNFNTPMFATSAGALPPGLLMNLFRGFDMVAVITLPLIFGLPQWVSGVLALIVFMAMRGSFNAEELRAEQEAQKKELARQKAEREAQLAAKNAAKQKVQVSRRR